MTFSIQFRIISVTLVIVHPLYGQPADPIALLRGVEQARKPLYGKLHLKNRMNVGQQEGAIDTDVEFDRDRWRFTQVQRVVVTTVEQGDEVNKVITANKGDPNAAVRAGLGKWQTQKTVSVFDGGKLVQYGDKLGAHIRVHQKGSAFLCFDIRILGISRSYLPSYSLSHCLGVGRAGLATTLGQEVVEGKPCWHVVFASETSMVDYHFWICDKEQFRVYCYEYRYPRDNPRLIVKQRLEYASDKDILPTRVTVEERYNNRNEISIYEISNADYMARPDETLFTLKGLDMPPGTMVIDDRVDRMVGYFNGTDLSKDYDDALGKAAVAAVEEIQPKGSGWPMYTLFAAIGLMVGGLGFLWLRRRRAG